MKNFEDCTIKELSEYRKLCDEHIKHGRKMLAMLDLDSRGKIENMIVQGIVSTSVPMCFKPEYVEYCKNVLGLAHGISATMRVKEKIEQLIVEKTVKESEKDGVDND